MEQDDYPISEERLREIAEERVRKRREELQGLVIHAVIYVFVNAIILSWNPWVAFFWGIGLFAHAWDYYNKYGPGRERHEKAVQREIERERERLYGSDPYEKPKRE